MYKTKVYIVETRNSAAGMRSAVATMAPLAIKLAKGEKLGSSKEEGYMPNGIRVNFFEDKRGSQRAVEMLVKKLAGKEFTTEFPMPDFDRVDPNPAVKGYGSCKNRSGYLRRYRTKGQSGPHRVLQCFQVRQV